jgi:hypothetical protein
VSEEMKRCPQCGEEILAIAKKCKHCSSNLDEESTAESAISGPVADYGLFLLAIPVVSTLLVWFWVSGMNLFQSPGSTMGLIMLATIIGTATVAAMEAGKVGMKSDRSKSTYGPTAWFFIIALFWIVGYPVYLFKRKHFGLANRLAAGILVALVFLVSWSVMFSAIESKKAEIRGDLEKLKQQMGSIGNPDQRTTAPLTNTADATDSPQPQDAGEDDLCGDHKCTEKDAVTAKIGMPVVPGAIICRDHDTVMLMMDRYKVSWEENFTASVIGVEKAKQWHGAPAQPPNVEQFGCVIVPPGTPMMWSGSWMPPVVIVKLSDGRTFKGVTNPSMIQVGSPPENNAVNDPKGWVGKFPLSVARDGRINNRFQALLGQSYDHFEQTLTQSTAMTGLLDDYYFGSGCNTHSCDTEQSAFAINKTDDRVFAAMVTDGNRITLFGASAAKELPPPLLDWYRGRGGAKEISDSVTQVVPSANLEKNYEPTQAASFDCKKAKSQSEILICNDAVLSKLDVELAEIYRQAKSQAIDAQAFKTQTVDAWKWREANCHDKECLVKWYADRKDALLGK